MLRLVCVRVEKKLSYLLDKEDEEMVVEDSFEAFQKIYHPIAQEKLKDVLEIRDGKFYIDSEDKATQKKLYLSINDNIYKNMDKLSITSYDRDHRWNKEESSVEEKELIVEKLMENDLDKQEKLMHEATDRILYAHRNLKAFMFFTSGPFFAALFLFKYTLKFSVLYFLYNKKIKSDKNSSTADHPKMQ